MDVGFAQKYVHKISQYQTHTHMYIYIYMHIYIYIYTNVFSRNRQQRYIHFRLPHKTQHNISTTEHRCALHYSRSHTTPRHVQKSLCIVSGAKFAGVWCSEFYVVLQFRLANRNGCLNAVYCRGNLHGSMMFYGVAQPCRANQWTLGNHWGTVPKYVSTRPATLIKGSWEAILPSYGWLLPDEAWCETVCYLTIHHERIDLDEGWCETLHCIAIHHKRIDLDEGWCETLHYITMHQKRIDLDEGWCETLHYITIHHKRIDLDEGWCETLQGWCATLHYIAIHHKRIDLDEGWCATLHCIAIHHKRIDLDEGWCETLYYITIHHKRLDLNEGRCETLYITIHHKRIDLDEGWCETLHKNTSQKNRPWWRAVWNFTIHNNTSQKNNR